MVLTAAVAAYMLLLVGLAVASPGIGFAGSLISFVPGDWRDWAHVPAYGFLAWLAMQGFRLRGWPIFHAICSGVLLTMLFGLWTEAAQDSIPDREASLHDVLNDTVGGIIAATLLLWQHRTAGQSSRLILIRTEDLRRSMKGSISR